MTPSELLRQKLLKEKESAPKGVSEEDKFSVIAQSAAHLSGLAFGGERGGEAGAKAAGSIRDMLAQQQNQKRMQEDRQFERELTLSKLDQEDLDRKQKQDMLSRSMSREDQQLALQRKSLENQMGKEKFDQFIDLQKLQQEQDKLKKDTSPQMRLTKLGAEDKKRLDNVELGKQAINRMAEALSKGQNTFSLVGDNDFTLARTQWEEAFGRMQSGGAISEKEEKRFRQLMPTATDSREIQASKLRQLSQEMDSRLSKFGLKPQDLPNYYDPNFEGNVQKYTAGTISGMSKAAAANVRAKKDPSQMTKEELLMELGE